MLDIALLRKQTEYKILAIGSYPIIQSILDFDFLCGKTSPSIVGILAGGRKSERFFFGKKEVLLPVFSSFTAIPEHIKESINLFLNLSSGRRVLESSLMAIDNLPRLVAGAIFAENVPEKHALLLFEKAKATNIFIVGPASVGLLLPGILKLGAIGGTDMHQFVHSHLLEKGNVAVFSSSGGMTNELINIVTSAHKRISFALSFGGDRFPIVTPLDACLAAEADTETEAIVYFGELGGYDEYEIADAIKEGRITKQIICYIAGSISDMFSTPPQFGHAKAMAGRLQEGAVAKRKALTAVGVFAANTFEEFIEKIHAIPAQKPQVVPQYAALISDMQQREKALIASSLSRDSDGKVFILGEELLPFVKKRSFGAIVAAMFLGKQNIARETEECLDLILRLLVDHGPYVSGAVNTIITARAGRDLVSSLAAGLLTIGPRFGGAINESAGNWLRAVSEKKDAYDMVESFAKQKKHIAGIGHKKYRVDFPDPRVAEITVFTEKLSHKRFTTFARNVEKITVGKKGNLILNVDGAIAAVLLDILSEKEGYSDEQLVQLIETEFFNALFVLSRSVGLIGHFIDQKRLDEGLFRLTEEQVAQA